MGIALGSNFDVQTGLPLDSRVVVADTTARDAISTLRRYEGLIVYVISEATNFQLVGGITDGDWQELSGSGGGGGLPVAWFPGTIGPELVEYAGLPAWKFTSTDQILKGMIKVPNTIPGDLPVTMRSHYVSDDTATCDTHLIIDVSMVKPGESMGTIYTRTSINAAKAQSAALAGVLQVVVNDVSNTTGVIDSEYVGPQQLIWFELKIGPSNTSTEPIYFFPHSSEITFV